jgi:hypothetical protein
VSEVDVSASSINALISLVNLNSVFAGFFDRLVVIVGFSEWPLTWTLLTDGETEVDARSEGGAFRRLGEGWADGCLEEASEWWGATSDVEEVEWLKGRVLWFEDGERRIADSLMRVGAVVRAVGLANGRAAEFVVAVVEKLERSRETFAELRSEKAVVLEIEEEATLNAAVRSRLSRNDGTIQNMAAQSV